MSFSKSALYPPLPNTTRGSSTKLSASNDKLVYANGKAIIIRDLNNPGLSVAYTGHTQPTTVARISPSGYYCASADTFGNVRIWDTVGEDQTLKGEYKVISGRINDLEWDGESKRILAVGDGRDKFGHAFMMDTGSSTGEIIGHSKVINAVSIRHQRPFRAATAADDNTIVFHQGAPYKYDKTIKTHTKFVQDLRYAPSGDHFASVGSDAKVFLYDGKTGDVLGEFEGESHKGTIMACSWSPDNKSLATAAADCTVKLWDVETRKSLTSYTLGSGVQHQQVGAVYTPSSFISLSISGDLNVFDPRVSTVARVLRGPQKAITSATVTGTGTFMTGTADGRVAEYNIADGEIKALEGEGHTNLVSGMAFGQGKVISVGYDDKVREIEGSSFVPANAPTSSQPRSVAVDSDGVVFVAGASTVEVFKSNQKLHEVRPPFVPSSISVSGKLVAVGGEDAIVHVYEWDGQALQKAGKFEGNRSVISALAFSPDGGLLASGESSGKVLLFDAKERTIVTSRWSFHSARINALAWTADGSHVASGSLDTHAYVWSVARPVKTIGLKNAGPGGVNSVLWLETDGAKGGRLATAGADGCVRTWEVKFHA